MSRNGDWIQTVTGRQFWPLDPRPEDIDINDVAHSLALKCRFNGHCRTFYSVAQHSVYVSIICQLRWPDRLDLWRWGLLHDVDEAYLPDVPRPLKHMGTGVLAECKNRIMHAAAEKWGLSIPEPEEIKRADQSMLMAEADQLMSRHPNDWSWNYPDELPADILILSTGWETSRIIFLNVFKQLFRR